MFDERPVRADRDADRQADAFFADLDLRANAPPRQKEELAHTTHHQPSAAGPQTDTATDVRRFGGPALLT